MPEITFTPPWIRIDTTAKRAEGEARTPRSIDLGEFGVKISWASSPRRL